eukprot:12077921-Alexandrium_andersonii.AAC.1
MATKLAAGRGATSARRICRASSSARCAHARSAHSHSNAPARAGTCAGVRVRPHARVHRWTRARRCCLLYTSDAADDM